MTARAAAAGPFATGSGLLADLAGIQVGARRIERHAEADGAAAAAVITAQAAAIAAGKVVPLPPAGLADKMYIAVDGTGVPMMTAETEGRDGKGQDGRGQDGRARTREVKLACVFTQTRVDEDGYPVRDPGSSSYLATSGPAARSGELMAAEARRRGARDVRQLTILGDGAHWIWNLAAEHFPEATQIVDLFHAREHLHDLGKMLAFMTGDTASQWLAERSAELDAGDIGALAAAARVFPWPASKPPSGTRPWPTSRPAPPACATATSAPAACSPAPASSKQAASPSSGSASNSPGCTGPYLVPPASSPALPASQRTLGRNLATAAQPDAAR
ncbi:MAG TPA: hypothetical protein VN969_48045 [Streptosporangiaceae bacterium]|nr:hypothetical protein [Streptosporangiaceae bacterium]